MKLIWWSCHRALPSQCLCKHNLFSNRDILWTQHNKQWSARTTRLMRTIAVMDQVVTHTSSSITEAWRRKTSSIWCGHRKSDQWRTIVPVQTSPPWRSLTDQMAPDVTRTFSRTRVGSSVTSVVRILITSSQECCVKLNNHHHGLQSWWTRQTDRRRSKLLERKS